VELSELGLDPWFKDKASELCGSGESIARVIAVDRGRYTVRNERGEVSAEVLGRFIYAAESPTDLPCVGDWVCVQYHDSGVHASIRHILPRKSCLKRKTPGRDVEVQMIAANIDVAIIVQSCHFDFNVRRLERYLVMVSDGHIEPLVLLTKTDLINPEELEQLVGKIRLAGIGARILTFSNVTREGIDQIREILVTGKTYCLIGSSGVGKTTLINRLVGYAGLETREVSLTGEGRHTTTRRQLIVLEQGGLLIDMPGMRELGVLGASEGIDDSFADIQEFAKNCRFANCTHSSEPGCAVRLAIEKHALNEERLQSYSKLKKESEFYELSYAEKRKKDRAFGRFIHSAMKSREK